VSVYFQTLLQPIRIVKNPDKSCVQVVELSNVTQGLSDGDGGGVLDPEGVDLGLALDELGPCVMRFLDRLDGFGGVDGHNALENVLGLAISGLVIDQPVDNGGDQLRTKALEVIKSIQLLTEFRNRRNSQDLVVDLTLVDQLKVTKDANRSDSTKRNRLIRHLDDINGIVVATPLHLALVNAILGVFPGLGKETVVEAGIAVGIETEGTVLVLVLHDGIAGLFLVEFHLSAGQLGDLVDEIVDLALRIGHEGEGVPGGDLLLAVGVMELVASLMEGTDLLVLGDADGASDLFLGQSASAGSGNVTRLVKPGQDGIDGIANAVIGTINDNFGL